MIFLNLFKLLLLFAGPIVGYRIAMRAVELQRWHVIAWCAGGGAAASLLMIGAMLFSEMSWFSTAGDLLRAAFPVVGEYTLFGFVVGFAAMLTPETRRRRLFVGGLAIVGLIALTGVGIDAANHVSEKAARGLVFGPGDVPAKNAPVFLDRGSGLLVRLRTDTAGQFRAPLLSEGYEHAMFLICAPGRMPTIVRLSENVVTRYKIDALPRHPRVRSQLRMLGWSGPIPRECLGNAA